MLSVYVHIPYCLQRCRYCDFTTFEQSEILPPEKYVGWVLQEIRHRHAFWTAREIETLYFGGGTPSLLSPELIVRIKDELANVGFTFTAQSEVTLEINPATLTEEKLVKYMRAGFNRFSVGAQTFDDALLKMCGRKHDAADTRETLGLLKKYNLNYSFDLLFALPGQTIDGLKLDLEEVARFAPPHLSAYCLTVPESHPMSFGRPPEDEQVEMFDLIERELLKSGIEKYEISNFAKPGFESRHNMSYWRDVSYWGIGLSSHSYMREHEPHGLRFWNPKSLNIYGEQVKREAKDFVTALPEDQFEALSEHEMLTDMCHMFLRTHRGLSERTLRAKCRPSVQAGLLSRLEKLVAQGLLEKQAGSWRLSTRGQLISNRVFGELTFLAEDLSEAKLGAQVHHQKRIVLVEGLPTVAGGEY
jgi:oxygen-independent coproporphyrinogen-3 oxidase